MAQALKEVGDAEIQLIGDLQNLLPAQGAAFKGQVEAAEATASVAAAPAAPPPVLGSL